MMLMFHRRLAIPLWTMAFIAVALTALAPAALSLVVVLGIALIAFTISGLVRWLRASPSVVQSFQMEAGIRGVRHVVVAGACVRTLGEPHRRTEEDEDALDLVRMDDDGGWQMARPPA